MDFVIRNARLIDRTGLFDICIAGERIAAIGIGLTDHGAFEDAKGALAFGGFVETHIHLDKACILDRCTLTEGTLGEAVRETARLKAGFTEEDVYHRAAHVVEKAILQGTTRMRTFVEIDPRAGFHSFAAIRRIKEDYRFAIDIEICAFAQEGLTNEPETYGMLEQALEQGAGLVGGCPYTDPDPQEHIRLIFTLAKRYDVDVDFHLDFDLDAQGSNLPGVIAATDAFGYGGRVGIGHATKLSAMPRDRVLELADSMAKSGVALTVLPATDLFLTGRDADRLVPRGLAPAHLLHGHGVTTAVASNNILNPFTPFGDASLNRMAGFYANVSQLMREDELRHAFAMVTSEAASLLGAPYGLVEGGVADIVLIDAPDPAAAVRETAPVLAGWKRGRQTFLRPRPTLLRPET